MLHSIAASSADVLIKNQVAMKEKRAIYVYGFELFYSFFFFLIFATAASVWLGYTKLLYSFLLFFVPIRLVGGGYHAKSYGSCFVLSNITAALGVGMACLLEKAEGIPVRIILTVVFFLSLVCIWHHVPIENPTHPMKRERIVQNRKRAHVLLVVDFAAGMLLQVVCHGPIGEIPVVAIGMVACLIRFAEKGE